MQNLIILDCANLVVALKLLVKCLKFILFTVVLGAPKCVFNNNTGKNFELFCAHSQRIGEKILTQFVLKLNKSAITCTRSLENQQNNVYFFNEGKCYSLVYIIDDNGIVFNLNNVVFQAGYEKCYDHFFILTPWEIKIGPIPLPNHGLFNRIITALYNFIRNILECIGICKSAPTQVPEAI
jgi:hypothetical protein